MLLSRDKFSQQLKDALIHFHDYAHLQNHPLIEALGICHIGNNADVQGLRRVLLEAIERFKPSDTIPFHASERRAYEILNLRFIEHASPCEIMQELALSPAQYYREQRKALDALTDLLWCQAEHPWRDVEPANRPTEEPITAAIPGGKTEYPYAGYNYERIALKELLAQVMQGIQALAQEHQVALELDPNTEPLVTSTDRTLLRLSVFSVLSHIVLRACGGKLTVTASQEYSHDVIKLAYAGLVSEADNEQIQKLEMARSWLQQLGGHLHLEYGSGNLHHAATHLVAYLRIPICPKTILVIDDDEATLQLFTRYASGQDVQIVSASSGAEGIQLASKMTPALIVLDVMMPSHDGWDVLLTLKHNPDTMHIPVIVCSVLNEPELALSMGASEFLRKPVDRIRFLATIRRW